MDHQVQDDADVGGAKGEAGRADGVDQPGAAEVRHRSGKGRIEPLDVADLEHAVMSPGGLDQRLGLGQGGRERLFHQQMDARLEEAPSPAYSAIAWGRQ